MTKFRIAFATLVLAIAASAAVPGTSFADHACTVTNDPDSNGKIYEGTGGDDWCVGSPYADKMFGYGGQDFLEGKGGNDDIYGGNGADDLYGGEGTDWIYGGNSPGCLTETGFDVLKGGPGQDVLDGGKGNDKGYGGDGADDFWDDDYSTCNDGSYDDDDFWGQGGQDGTWTRINDGDWQDEFYGGPGDDECPAGDDNGDHIDLGSDEEWGHFGC